MYYLNRVKLYRKQEVDDTMAQKDLIPLNKRTKEEQKEISTKGGIASGKARKEKATMKKVLQSMLEEVAKVDGNKDKLTYKQLATLGLIKGAMYGKAENYKTILEAIGEIENKNETPNISINIVDNGNLEKALYEEDDI